jgi:hypothetical protein
MGITSFTLCGSGILGREVVCLPTVRGMYHDPIEAVKVK